MRFVDVEVDVGVGVDVDVDVVVVSACVRGPGSPRPGTWQALKRRTGSPATIGHWGLASWPGPPSVTVMAGERWPSCIPPGLGQGPRGHLHDEASRPAVPLKYRSHSSAESGRRCSAALDSLGAK